MSVKARKSSQDLGMKGPGVFQQGSKVKSPGNILTPQKTDSDSCLKQRILSFLCVLEPARSGGSSHDTLHCGHTSL